MRIRDPTLLGGEGWRLPLSKRNMLTIPQTLFEKYCISFNLSTIMIHPNTSETQHG